MNNCTRIHILLVDDEADVESIFKFYFGSWIKAGHVKLSFTLDGVKALEKIEENFSNENDIVLVYSDINMPNKDGLSLLEEIKAVYPHIDVFMVSGNASNTFISKSKELGATDFYEKPVDFDKLKADLVSKFPHLN